MLFISLENFFISPFHLIVLKRHLNFCPDFLFMQQNGLIRKLRFVSKLMTPQTVKKESTIHILPNTSRRKCNQTMELCQFIEYVMRNTFLKNSYLKSGGETSPRTVLKKPKLGIFLDQHSEHLYSLFLLYVQVESQQNISKLRC